MATNTFKKEYKYVPTKEENSNKKLDDKIISTVQEAIMRVTPKTERDTATKLVMLTGTRKFLMNFDENVAVLRAKNQGKQMAAKAQCEDKFLKELIVSCIESISDIPVTESNDQIRILSACISLNTFMENYGRDSVTLNEYNSENNGDPRFRN